MEKECSKCKEVKDTSEFAPGKNKDGLEAACKECRTKRRYEARIERRIKNGQAVREFGTLEVRKLLEEGKRYCPGCHEVKELSDFSVGKRIASHCKVCSNIFFSRMVFSLP